MAETVAAPPRGLELFAPPGNRTPLRVTTAKAAALAKLGIESVQDLLQHYPRHHVDRTHLRTIRQLVEDTVEGHEVQIHAKVLRVNRPIETRRKPGRKPTVIITATIGDETGRISVTWFNQAWVSRALRPGTEAFFYGKLTRYRGKPQMSAPRFEIVRSGKEPFNVGRIVPIYPATTDVTSDQIRRLVWDALQRESEVLDPLPVALRRKLRLISRHEAIRRIHFPDTRDDVHAARRRLVFDELFTLQLGLVYRKRKLERTVQGIEHPVPTADSLPEIFVGELPFELTAAQRRACDEVATDMARTYPMHRLIEGEVGSGKTVVAVYGCLVAIEGRRQAALMAPTEVLAEQHFLTVNELLDRAFGAAEGRNLFAESSNRPVVRLLTGSTPPAQREEILRGVAFGEVDLLVGTHALIEDTVEFARLGLAVVDEQHRFGVHQRKRLREKGVEAEPDILVMTATPIPRTLAVTIYGDLDVSILDELPRGRQPVSTSLAEGDEGRSRAYELVRSEVTAGRQAFIVYALRDESDKVEIKSAKSEATRLAEKVFPDLEVGLVHGDMRSSDKEMAMAAFRDGKTQVLVATTVVEVGVDVPNATVMIVENAERFGLAQLHQLRGRIGRGAHASHCVLITDLDISTPEGAEANPLIAERLRAIRNSRDGFSLALVDLRQRGEGHLFGARQSGMPQLKMARVLEHQDVIKQARDLAVQLLDADPELREFEHLALEKEMRQRFPERALDVVQSG